MSLLTRNGHDWTHRFGGVPQGARALQAETALIDGEMVVLGERGVSSFAHPSGWRAGLCRARRHRLDMRTVPFGKNYVVSSSPTGSRGSPNPVRN